MDQLLSDIHCCTLCAAHFQHETRPVLSAHPKSKIVIIGQAPGSVVHKTGIPWGDKSGDNLRSWLHVDKETFYDAKNLALIPMGFCYPGKGKSGDLPPRPECAPHWHQPLLNQMTQVQLTILIGQYAQRYYLANSDKNSLTENVRQFRSYLPEYFVLPHPSPRNNIWRAKNPWFDQEVIPALREKVSQILH